MLSNSLKRRDVIRTSLTGGAVLAAVGVGLLRPGVAFAGNVRGWPAKPFDDKVLSSAMMDSVGKTNIAVSTKVKRREWWSSPRHRRCGLPHNRG